MFTAFGAQICTQRDGRGAARRADASASAEELLLYALLCGCRLQVYHMEYKPFKGKAIRFNDSITVMKTVGVEAGGCELLAHSRYAVAPRPGSNARPLERKSDAIPLRHHATVNLFT